MVRSDDGNVWSSEFERYQKLISLNIRRLRDLKQISQEKLGLQANVDRTLVSKIERCIANPSSVHSIDLGGDVTGNGVGAIIFTILSAFASFERERIASRISEVKQMRKSQGYFVGGRRGFGFNVKNGKKVPNIKEQKLIVEMKKKKANGESMLAINGWLNVEMCTKLNYSSMRRLLVLS